MDALELQERNEMLIHWASRKLSKANDIVDSVNNGEHNQFIHVTRKGAGDETRESYMDALRDISYLELLIATLESAKFN